MPEPLDPTLRALAHEILLAYGDGWEVGVRMIADTDAFSFMQQGGIGHAGPSRRLENAPVRLLIAEGFLEHARTNAGGTKIYRIAARFHEEARLEALGVYRLDPKVVPDLVLTPTFAPVPSISLTSQLVPEAAMPKARGTNQARLFRPKVCACGATFTPSGPRSTRCERCRATTRATAELASRSPTASSRPRTFREKPCARCGEPFLPTGPRSTYCDRPECRNATARSA